MSKNLILCGFMGAGKTSTGQELAMKSGKNFIDCDDLIVEKMKIPVADIFRIYGEDYYRDIEHEVIVNLSGKDDYIISTGGGAVTAARNVAALKNNGIILFLNPGFDVCYSRIKNSDRPIVRRSSFEELRDLYRRREILYRNACDIEISLTDTVSEVADYIINRVNS